MNASKKIIYIADITLHSKDFRATPSLVKAEERKIGNIPSPRFYSPMTKLDATAEEMNADGTFKMVINLPPDLQEGLKNGEIELRPLHPDGIHIYPGKDLIEKIQQMQKKERRQLIHNSSKWQGK